MLIDFDLIVTYLKNGLLALMAVVAYLYLVTSAYPRLTLRRGRRKDRRGTVSGDRGVRKLVFYGGYAMVYEPAPAVRRYIRYYALFKEDGCTFIQCRINRAISHIRYDVAAFDARDRLLDVLSVSELVVIRGQTRVVRLPRDTAYVSVTLRKADAVYVSKSAAVYHPVNIAVYAVLTVATTVAAALILQSTLTEICASIPLEGEAVSTALVAVLGVILGLATAAWGVLTHCLRASKVVNQ